MEMRGILQHFCLDGDVVSIVTQESGHINATFVVTVSGGRRYILQKINTTVFRNTDRLMENIVNVTSHLRKKILEKGGDPERETLTVILTTQGKTYYKDSEGNDWRVYLYIEGTETFEQVNGTEDFYRSGLAFGRFQELLADYPASTLYEVIPAFHDTGKRYRDFEKAVEEDLFHRVKEVEPEIAFIRERAKETTMLTDLLANGELPLRVTHNDTKLSNIMLDIVTHESICIIDLDTVMPGLSAYDFGDSIRFGANTAAEDETDISKVSLSMELYRAYTRGFIKGCNGMLSPKEIEMLPLGAKLMTMECGMRFLADYLQGDIYYRIKRERHNLDRCRTQLALIADMEDKWNDMCDIDNIISL